MTTSIRVRRTTVAGTAAAVLAAQAVVQLAGATPAAAALPGYQIVQASSATDSSSFKAVTVNCPTGKRVIGTGFHLLGAQGEIVLDDLIPSATSVSLSADEDQDGTAATWKITAIAVCANQPAGYSITFGSSTTAPGSIRSATATCPGSTQVLGTGVAVGGGAGQVAVSNLLPSTNSVTAYGITDGDGFAGSWSIHPYAICANPLPGRTQVTAGSTTDSSTSKIVSANCPTGRNATGQGWGFGSGSQGFINYAGIGNTGVTQIVNEDDDGSAATWSLATTVVCATA